MYIKKHNLAEHLVFHPFWGTEQIASYWSIAKSPLIGGESYLSWGSHGRGYLLGYESIKVL